MLNQWRQSPHWPSANWHLSRDKQQSHAVMMMHDVDCDADDVEQLLCNLIQLQRHAWLQHAGQSTELQLLLQRRTIGGRQNPTTIASVRLAPQLPVCAWPLLCPFCVIGFPQLAVPLSLQAIKP
jgi:hypothetical protein